MGHNMEVAQAGRLVGLPYRRPQVWSLMVFLSVVTALHRWTRTNVWLCLSLILMDWGLSWGGPHPGLTLLGHNTHQLYCDPEKYWAAEMVIIYLLFYYYFKWSLQFIYIRSIFPSHAAEIDHMTTLTHRWPIIMLFYY